jgi:hypothetical protein
VGCVAAGAVVSSIAQPGSAPQMHSICRMWLAQASGRK